jgi:hypothetical protein
LELIEPSAAQARNVLERAPRDIRDQEIHVKRNKLLVTLGGAIGLLVFSSSLLAHHGTANYDRDHPVTLTGVVTDYEFVNPHVRIRLDVKTVQGDIEKWVAEAAPPQRMFRAGWRTDSVKMGDQITVSGFPMKDGTKLLGLQQLTTPTGTVLTPGQ